MYKELIDDDRLTPDLERMRSGKEQHFRNRNRNFHDTDYVVAILKHERPEMYAELIDDKWYWVSGCAECNGEPRDWNTYIECDEHNRCRECGENRKDIEGIPWGGKHGWCCVSCMNKLNEAHRLKCLAKVAEKEYDTWDYMHTDNIICPHCGDDFEVDDNPDYFSGESECETCGGKYECEVDYSVSYTTTVIGERIVR